MIDHPTFTPIPSSQLIEGYRYDWSTRRLVVNFRDGNERSYEHISGHHVAGMTGEKLGDEFFRCHIERQFTDAGPK